MQLPPEWFSKPPYPMPDLTRLIAEYERENRQQGMKDPSFTAACSSDLNQKRETESGEAIEATDE